MNPTPQPLNWGIDWDKLNDWQRVFLDFPYFGSAPRTQRRLRKQMSKRRLVDMLAWDGYPAEVRRYAFRVSEILKECLEWPNPYFLPDDPADIPFWCFSSDMREVDAILEVGKIFGVDLPEDFWKDANTTTFSEFIQGMMATRAKQSDGENGSDALPAKPESPVRRP